METTMQESGNSLPESNSEQNMYYDLVFPKRKRSKATEAGGDRARMRLDEINQGTGKRTCNSAPIPTCPRVVISAKNDIHVQPNPPSSSLINEFESITDHFIDFTNKQDDLSDISEDDETTQLNTLLGTITECERFLASVKKNAVAYRDSTAELRAKLQVADTESKESAAAFTGEIMYLKKDIKARDDEIARLRGVTDRLSRQKHQNAKLVLRNAKLESTVEVQSAKLKKLENWRTQMRRILSEEDAES
ncbi:uncharacterized protein EAE97_002933 [Botrytis byssoidea]|uniref:Uncharacterized protein n=1 Tax=Botrytis byssoidea TaxID=139641 RepID=A0A9P5IVT5_9HELO|nr:uncharacterized protein EAE97_002933 [Botrytis byssoidea]KAF7949424.1 hypothetical protein EAE97_002933 [Botrytis byssoidea]